MWEIMKTQAPKDEQADFASVTRKTYLQKSHL